eukprot:COSAG01_NODE_253_length_20220_cov_22.308196_2_plen_194_part_00
MSAVARATLHATQAAPLRHKTVSATCAKHHRQSLAQPPSPLRPPTLPCAGCRCGFAHERRSFPSPAILSLATPCHLAASTVLVRRKHPEPKAPPTLGCCDPHRTAWTSSLATAGRPPGCLPAAGCHASSSRRRPAAPPPPPAAAARLGSAAAAAPLLTRCLLTLTQCYCQNLQLEKNPDMDCGQPAPRGTNAS